ncbi:hypothetical protein [Mycobacteroides sp. PCS013]|uniref:hypothetical protein n=1 Tax=Mycobacteroides sp. PCS013 TaxID=3074106 RepID=UPI003C2EFC79
MGARDHARVNLNIWGDDDFRELPVDAQALYWMLWTSPGLSYCGAHVWHSGKLAQSAGDWTAARIEAAAATLAAGLFLIVDIDTEECLLRSWIKHDGLWKSPNMAVAMANARAGLGSRTLRGVVVHEVKKLAAAQPDLSSWTRDVVQKMLVQKAVDPADIPPFNRGPNGGANPRPDRLLNPSGKPSLNPSGNGYREGSSNPSCNPSPTTSTSPTPNSLSQSDYVSGVPHQSAEPVPPPYCNRHPNGTDLPCGACAVARRAHDAAAEAEYRRVRAERRDALAHRQECSECDSAGWRLDSPDDAAVKCTHGAATALQLVHSDANHGRAAG